MKLSIPDLKEKHFGYISDLAKYFDIIQRSPSYEKSYWRLAYRIYNEIVEGDIKTNLGLV